MFIHRLALACILTTAVVTPARAATERDPSGSAAVVRQSPARAPTPPRGAALGSRAEEQRYAAREAASPDAKKYRAGDVIVISASALAIILLVILIIVLI